MQPNNCAVQLLGWLSKASSDSTPLPPTPSPNPRLQYHAQRGVSRLYLLYTGDSAAAAEALAALPRVELMMADSPLAEAAEVADFAAYVGAHDNNDGWKGQPGVYARMVKQGARGVKRRGFALPGSPHPSPRSCGSQPRPPYLPRHPGAQRTPRRVR